MNFEKYIDKDNKGTYCIVFQNRDGLEQEEIKKIFSEFGKVFSVICAGNERGYHFVRYGSYEEAFDAVEKLKNHPSIKIAEHRKKQEKSNSNNYTNGNSTQLQNGNYKKTSPQDRIAKNRMITPNPKTENNSNNFLKTSDVSEKNSDCNNIVSIISSDNNSNNQKVLSSEMCTPESEGNQFEDAISASESICKNSNNKDQYFSSLPDAISRSEQNSTKSSSIKNDVDVDSKDEVPDLISLTGKGMQVHNQKRIIFDAEEVIVGNIPAPLGSPYILHLLDRFEPIAISMINTLQKSGIRYCSVYFKSLQDALQVEHQFDQMDLLGKQLVALRPCQLIEEGV